MKDVYGHVLIHRDIKRFLPIRNKNIDVKLANLPFELTTSSRLFTRVRNAVFTHLTTELS